MRSAPELVNAAVEQGVIPGAVLAAGIGNATPVLLHVAGDAQRDADARRPMSADTIFHVASLTKVVATLPCVLRLVAGGQVGLDDSVRRFLPAFGRAGEDRVTVRQLLTHTSGLPYCRRHCEYLHGPAGIRSAALSEPLVAAPGSVFCYSDIGFVALGELSASLAGCGLGQLTADLVCGPLDMVDTRYLPAPTLSSRFASNRARGRCSKDGRRPRRERGGARRRGGPRWPLRHRS
jgi:CubicO group peptidase (beta-lactamase class C family)